MRQGQAPKGLEAVMRFRKCKDDPAVEAVVEKLRANNAVTGLRWQT
jgi:hypothetical protein